MKKISIITTSRADYGILEDLIDKLNYEKNIKIYLFITGTHTSKKYGSTFNSIKKKYKNIIVAKTNHNKDDKSVILKNINKISVEFESLVNREKINNVVLLGDRYELLGISLVCLFYNIKVFHLHGGEVTKGSYDNIIRLIVTSVSNCHLVSHKKYKVNVQNYLNTKNNIFHVGSLAAEKIKNLKKNKKLLNPTQITEKYELDFSKKIILISLHPETINKNENKKSYDNLFYVLSKFHSCIKIFTSPGHDKGSDYIFKKIKIFIEKETNSIFINSIPYVDYLSIMRYSNCFIGNSSSGIIESPTFNLPFLNLGTRQSGRLKSKNIIDSSFMRKNLMINLTKLLKKNRKEKDINVFYKKNSLNSTVKIIKKNLL